jgi:hypothetical protein
MVTDQLKEVQETFGKHVQNGALANIMDEKELMESVKKLLESRQKEDSSPQKVCVCTLVSVCERGGRGRANELERGKKLGGRLRGSQIENVRNGEICVVVQLRIAHRNHRTV